MFFLFYQFFLLQTSLIPRNTRVVRIRTAWRGCPKLRLVVRWRLDLEIWLGLLLDGLLCGLRLGKVREQLYGLAIDAFENLAQKGNCDIAHPLECILRGGLLRNALEVNLHG